MLRSWCKVFSIIFMSFTTSVNCALLQSMNDYEALLITRDHPQRVYDAQKLAKYNYPGLTSPTATACPMETPEEQAFNNQHSLGKHVLFVRHIYGPSKTSTYINHQICHTPYKMSVVYYTIGVEFQFGFEIYYDKGMFGKDAFIDSKWWYYDLVTNAHSTKNHLKPLLGYVPRQAAALGSLVPSPVTTVVSKVFPGQKFYLENKTELGFVWATAFHMKFNFRAKRLAQTVYNLSQATQRIQECDDWDLGLEYYTQFGIPIADLYSEGNQKRMLEGIKLPAKNPEDQNEEDASCESENQCFTKWLSLPPEQFQFLAAKPVSCSYLLAVPIWKSTIEGVLKKLDNFIHTISKLIGHPHGVLGVHSGIQGDLQLPIDGENKKALKKITLTENNIPAPNIIYKLVKYKPFACEIEIDENDLANMPDELKDLLESDMTADESNQSNDNAKLSSDGQNDELKQHAQSKHEDEGNHSSDKNDNHEADNKNDNFKEQHEKNEPKKPSESSSNESYSMFGGSDESEDSESEEPACVTIVTTIAIIIHNNPNYNPEKDKICNDMCSNWGWDEIQYKVSDGRRFKSKYIYCCKASDAQVRKKLGLNNDEDSKDSDVFALNDAPLPKINKKDFLVRDIHQYVVDEYKKLFERGQPESEENNAVEPLIDKNVIPERDFLKMRKPKHDGDEPVKSETQLVDDAGQVDNSSQKNEGE